MQINIWRTLIVLATIYAAQSLIRDWPSYKEIFHKLTTSESESLIAAFSEDIKRNPKDPRNYSVRAHVLLEAKRYDEALSDYLKAIEVDPNFDFSCVVNISNVYLLKGNTLKAREYLAKAKKIFPYPEMLLYDEALIDDFENKRKRAFWAYSEYFRLVNLAQNDRKRIFILKRRIGLARFLGDFSTLRPDTEQLRKELPNDKVAETIAANVEKKETFELPQV
jgi:tetratricopeptide (TPR) repeat protein